MNIKFGFLEFEIKEDSVSLVGHGDYKTAPQGFAELQLAGKNVPSHLNGKTVRSSESKNLKYFSHSLGGNKLVITQKSESVTIRTTFEKFSDGRAISVYNEIINESVFDIIIENAPSFVLKRIFDKPLSASKSIYFTKFLQGHHSECQPRKNSFDELGLYDGSWESQRKVFFASVGSQTTKEQLPLGIIEDVDTGAVLEFRINSGCSWFYELSDYDMGFYLSAGSAELNHLGWAKKLSPNESYKTVSMVLSYGKSLYEASVGMTDYLRTIKPQCLPDANLPTIFNEYMHLSWDCPAEERVRELAPTIAKTGVKYYVIDCGWHNEEDGDKVYPYVGQWKESKRRFPGGIRATTDFIRACGMKAGLWIEPEIVGVNCKEMLEFYDDDCFITRFGKKIAVGDRYFLDYRNQKVRNYMTETIRRMVEDYGVDYIKFDYNQDIGVGTDSNAFALGEGLEACANAYLEWIGEMTRRFDNVVFENCASGGMRLDYKFLSKFSLVSTSDQTDYRLYPYIAGNISFAVLPEQAAVWSYPVDSYCGCGEVFSPDYDSVNAKISEEQVIFNMVNSFLGRMHLASYVNFLNERKFELIKEGIKVYDGLSEFKKSAYPFLPNGFCRFGYKLVASGLINGDKIILAVWNTGEAGCKTVDLGVKVKSFKTVYPKNSALKVVENDGIVKIEFTESYQARLFEIIKEV